MKEIDHVIIICNKKLLYNYNNDKIIATNDLKPNLTSVPGVVKVLR